MIKLRTASWSLKHVKTVRTPKGEHVDMFTLVDEREIDPETADIVSLAVPRGRADIARFIMRSVVAGQKVLQGLPLGHALIPDEQPGFEQPEDQDDGQVDKQSS